MHEKNEKQQESVEWRSQSSGWKGRRTTEEKICEKDELEPGVEVRRSNGWWQWWWM